MFLGLLHEENTWANNPKLIIWGLIPLKHVSCIFVFVSLVMLFKCLFAGRLSVICMWVSITYKGKANSF